MLGHERFEELAVLAAVGELSPDEWHEFDEHSKECTQCRQVVGEAAGVSAALFQSETPTVQEVLAERSRKVHARMAVANRVAICAQASGRCTPDVSHVTPVYAFAAILLFIAGVSTGLSLRGGHILSRPLPGSAQISNPSVPETTELARRELEEYHNTQAAQKKEIDNVRSENERLHKLLSNADERSNKFENAITAKDQELDSQTRELSQTASELSTNRSFLAQVQLSASSSEAALIDLRYKLVEAENKLKDATDSLNRERQLLDANREIREIMGARDLHIVDVFDTDGKGRTKRSFGRAFYTEGKSLIFYAFDLPTPKNKKGEFAYRAWGRNSNFPHGPTHSLGMFFNDDRSQKRWVMKFDDPKVLSEIDTVFVTLEPQDRDLSAPTGKAILDAYFGTPPNHP